MKLSRFYFRRIICRWTMRSWWLIWFWIWLRIETRREIIMFFFATFFCFNRFWNQGLIQVLVKHNGPIIWYFILITVHILRCNSFQAILSLFFQQLSFMILRIQNNIMYPFPSLCLLIDKPIPWKRFLLLNRFSFLITQIFINIDILASFLNQLIIYSPVGNKYFWH